MLHQRQPATLSTQSRQLRGHMRLSKLLPKISHKESLGSSQGELPVIAADRSTVKFLRQNRNRLNEEATRFSVGLARRTMDGLLACSDAATGSHKRAASPVHGTV